VSDVSDYRGLLLTVYRPGDGQTFNNWPENARGLAPSVTNVVLVDDDAPKIVRPKVDAPAVRIVRRNLWGKPAWYVVPIGFTDGEGMHGGTYVGTSDSRFTELCAAVGYPAPTGIALLPVHDRIER
jgi:hypothetical protein